MTYNGKFEKFEYYCRYQFRRKAIHRRERRPTTLLHSEDRAVLGVAPGERVRQGIDRGYLIVHVKPVEGQQRGVVVVEGIWPNRQFENGIGINALTSAEPGWPNGGAVFHDTAVWVRRVV